MPHGTGATSFVPTTDLAEASPNKMFMFFLFHRWDVFQDAMMRPDQIDIDTTIASLLSTCTDKIKRKEFYDLYIAYKKEADMTPANAAILVSGEFFAYVAEACEFVEKSYGAAG